MPASRLQSAKPGLAVGAIIALLLGLHTGLLAWSAYCHSPVVSEVSHLPSGIRHWQLGRFDLYRVNPPLVRMVAALPVLLAHPNHDWTRESTDPLQRSEVAVGLDFIRANGKRSFWLYTLGRWACIPFSWVGAWICYRWARDLYGGPSGILAMALWCFCPNVLGNAALIVPDIPATALAVAACYSFWRWLGQPTWSRALLAGVLLGIAELTKTSLVILVVLWPLLWLLSHHRHLFATKARLRQAGMLAVQLLIAIDVINMGYAFEGSFRRLGAYRFQSHILTGAPRGDRRFAEGNRFRDTPLASLPVPLPRNYVQGIDTQKIDFEAERRSYLAGHWSPRGWWYFYLYALAIKLPLGVWMLAIIAIVVTVSGHRGVSWRDELVVILPLLAILAFISSQTGFSIHFRYALPALPFLFIWVAKSATAYSDRRWPLAVLTTAAAIWVVASSLRVYPHSLSYFNELAGGPEHGHEQLLDSGISWGQDLLYLKQWYDDHDRPQPFYLASFGFVDPRTAGIRFSLPPFLPPGAETSAIQPGWYAVDVNYLCGSQNPISAGPKGFVEVPKDALAYLRNLTPVARVGYSFRIFHLTPQDAERIGKEWNLRSSKPQSESESKRSAPAH